MMGKVIKSFLSLLLMFSSFNLVYAEEPSSTEETTIEEQPSEVEPLEIIDENENDENNKTEDYTVIEDSVSEEVDNNEEQKDDNSEELEVNSLSDDLLFSSSSNGWQYETDSDYKTYGYSGGGITVRGYSGSSVSNLVIPSTIDGKTVTSISFYDQENLKQNLVSVTIPSTVKMIGNACFYEFEKLKNVNINSDSQLEVLGQQCFRGTAIEEFTIPSKVRTALLYPFYGCVNLKKVTFNDIIEPFLFVNTLWSGNDTFKVQQHFNPAPYAEDVEYIVPSTSKYYKVYDGALMSKDGTIFYGHARNLTRNTFNVPEGTKIIGYMALFGAENLTNLTLPNGLERIEEYAFTYTDITSLIIPDSVTYVGGSICRECPNLETVVIGNGVTELGNQAGWTDFYKCSKLKNLTLGNSIKVIGGQAFLGTAITEINLPSSLTQINYAAFGDCKQLTKVTGGENLDTLYNYAFAGTSKLTTFPMNSNSSKYKYVSGTAFYNSAFKPTYPTQLTKNESGDYVKIDAVVNIKGDILYSESFKVLQLVNQQRRTAGLNELTMDKDLLDVAVQRSAEVAVNVSHTRPDGQDFYTVNKSAFGSYWAENIAAGQNNANAVMNSWMNSSGHKANILSNNVNQIGIAGFKNNGTIYWVQVFGYDTPTSVSQPSNTTKTMSVNLLDSQFKPSFSITPSSYLLYNGTKTNLTIKITNNSFEDVIVDDSCINWKSSNPSVATVSENGEVNCIKKGDSVITAAIDKTTEHYNISYTVNVLDESDRTVAMFRMYNPNSGEHFYTAVVEERNNLIYVGWRYEGIGWYAPSKGTPVYRLYNKNGGEHHYTTNESEKDTLVKIGWNYEGIGWYSGGEVPIRREYNPNQFANNHNYTKDTNEHNTLIRLGWKDEGVGWYGVD